MDSPLAQFDHPAWLTGLGTLIGYGLVLLVLFVLMFVIPLGIFMALG